MGAHAYYAKEKKVFADAYGTKCTTEEEARLAVTKLCKKLGVKVYLRFRGYRGGRYNTSWRVTLPHGPSYGLIAHELAHAVQHQVKSTKWHGDRWHSDEHWAIMQDIIVQMREDGWLAGALRLSLDKKAERKAETLKRRLSKEASRDMRSEKIEKRRDQIARLEKKVKALQTRLKTAKRSLAALERARSKKDMELVVKVMNVEPLATGERLITGEEYDRIMDAVTFDESKIQRQGEA